MKDHSTELDYYEGEKYHTVISALVILGGGLGSWYILIHGLCLLF